MLVTAPSANLSPGEQVVAKVSGTDLGTVEADRVVAHTAPHHPGDTIELSLTATVRLVMEAPNIAAGQLESLLQEFDRPTQSITPRAIGELAAKIGTAAYVLGNSVSVILPRLEVVLPRPIVPVAPIVYTDGALLTKSATPTGVGQPRDQRTGIQERELQPLVGQELKVEDKPSATNTKQQLQDAANSVLRNATIILERMQLHLHESDIEQLVSSEFDQGSATSANATVLNETKVAFAQSQVAHAEHLVADFCFDRDSEDQESVVSNTLKVKPANYPSSFWPWLQLVPGMFCLAFLWWLISQIDFRFERVVSAILVVIVGSIWGLRKLIQWRRLKLELGHQAEQG